MDDSHIYFVYQVLTLPLTRGTSVDLKRKLMVIFSRALAVIYCLHLFQSCIKMPSSVKCAVTLHDIRI